MSSSILLQGADSVEKSFSQLLRCQLDTKKDLRRTTWEQMKGALRGNVFIVRAGVSVAKGGEGWWS